MKVRGKLTQEYRGYEITFEEIRDVKSKEVRRKVLRLFYGYDEEGKKVEPLTFNQIAKAEKKSDAAIISMIRNGVKKIMKFREKGIGEPVKKKSLSSSERDVREKMEKQPETGENTSQKMLLEIADACEYFAEGFRSISGVFRTLSKRKESMQPDQILKIFSSVVYPVEEKEHQRESGEKSAEDG